MAIRRSLAVIKSIKHYVQLAPTNVTAGSVLVVAIANAVVAPATGNSSDVAEGSVVKAVYIEMWALGQGSTGAAGTMTAIVEKRPSGVIAPTFAQIATLGAYPNKKNVLYSTQGNFGSTADGSPSFNVFKGWIRIPKGKQRMGSDDNIDIVMTSNAQTTQFCGIMTYKEYQ